MNKIKITGSTSIPFHLEIDLPAFFKDRTTDHYVGIIDESGHLSVNDGWLTKSVAKYSGWYPDISLAHFVKIDHDTFYSALMKCQLDIDQYAAPKNLEHSHDNTSLTGS